MTSATLSNSLTNPDQLAAFQRMRMIATALVVLMGVTFGVSKAYEDTHLAVEFIRAFSEAALVGALADWFAVTALFRRPLGLPIPHTAIVPRSKDRIGNGLGNFLRRNFLQPEQVAKRLEPHDLTGIVSDWLSNKDRASRIAKAISAAVPRLVGILNDDRISGWLQTTLANRIKATDIPTLLADGIDLLTRNNRHKPIVDLILFHADLAVHSQEEEFRTRVSDQTNWLPKLFQVDSAASDALLGAIKETLKEAAKDPDHRFRQRIDDALAHFAHDLRFNPNLRDQLTNWVAEMTNHPAVGTFVNEVWNDLKASLSNPQSENPDRLSGMLASGLERLADALKNDADLRNSLNARLKAWAVELSEHQGNAIVQMVSETIQGWDAKTVVNQLETAVGRDLQYIRINGTVIGGLVGVVLHVIVLVAY